MLAAPMQWKFNRVEAINLFSTVVGLQDYEETISGFGFLEKSTVKDSTGKTWEIKDVQNNLPLASSTTQARPTAVAVQDDDGNSTYTFRFSAVPDQIYAVSLVYQKGPVKFANLTDSWAPIPDAFSDIYNNLCLGYYMDSCQDPRAPQYISRGIAGLLARAQGLSQLDKALFAQSYMDFSASELLNQLKTQQGQQAQQVR